jgi:hypothetical protein
MAELNYKQIIYGGMIAIAGVDGEVDRKEKRWVNTVFHHDFGIHRKEKQEVLKLWENNKDEFTNMIISDLQGLNKLDQKEVFKRICQFILFRHEEYNKSSKAVGKGIDPEKEQLNKYRERAERICKTLTF